LRFVILVYFGFENKIMNQSILIKVFLPVS